MHTNIPTPSQTISYLAITIFWGRHVYIRIILTQKLLIHVLSPDSGYQLHTLQIYV